MGAEAMSADLLSQLGATLGTAYTIERELGGGGMARVFVAVETALARRVVIKVLSPDLAAGVSAQRFAREIRLAASLQQANIVPVLSAGETDGLPYCCGGLDSTNVSSHLQAAEELDESSSIMPNVIGSYGRADGNLAH